jgi:hypothetical protein
MGSKGHLVCWMCHCIAEIGILEELKKEKAVWITASLGKKHEQVIFSVTDKSKEDDLTHIMYLIYSGRCQYFRYLRYPMNASSSKYLFCARSAQEKKDYQYWMWRET